MTHGQPNPESSVAPATVDRAIAEIRRGGVVVVSSASLPPILAASAEMLDQTSLERLARLTKPPVK